MKFDLGEVSTDAAITIAGSKTEATITLNPPTVATAPTNYTEPEFVIGRAYCYGALESLTGIEEYGICWSTEFFNPNETQVNYAVGNDWNDGVFSAPSL